MLVYLLNIKVVWKNEGKNKIHQNVGFLSVKMYVSSRLLELILLIVFVSKLSLLKYNTKGMKMTCESRIIVHIIFANVQSLIYKVQH